MKRKAIAAAILAAAMILSGCSEGGGESLNSVSVCSAAAFPSSSAEPANSPASTSTRSGAPTVVAPSFNDTSSDVPANSSPTEPVSTPPEIITPIGYDEKVIDKETYIGSGEVLRVECGEMLVLDADVTVEAGGAIVVNEGGLLLVAWTVKLDGDLVLYGDGKLTMLDDDSLIDGSGTIIVGTDFYQIDCGYGTIKAHIQPPERVVRNGATYVGGIVIANKAITLPPEFGSHLSYDSVEPEVYEALNKMNKDSVHQYRIVSGYRDYWSQKAIFERYCDRDGYEEAATYSAKEGHSEHQTGYTMDLDSLYESYGDTPEGKWLAKNCWKYGFIIRYPKGKEDITGYTYEPWHVRWIGSSTAKLVYDSGLTLEEFLNVEGGWEIID